MSLKMKSRVFKSGDKQSGFTLVEMIAVVAVIAILVSITVPTLSYIYKTARIKAAKADVAKLELALEMYRTDFYAYPPDEAAAAENGDTGKDVGTGWGAPNGYEGENLYYFLGARFVHDVNSYRLDKDVGPYINFKEDDLTFVANNVVDFDGDGDVDDPIYQVVDPWGNAYIYRENESDSTYTGTKNTKTFTIYSLGPDKRDGTGDGDGDGVADDVDNITNWRRPEE